MLPEPTVPASLLAVLDFLRGCFTYPTLQTFAVLVTGLIAQTGRCTVTGMLAGAGLTRAWSHDRAHTFFSRAAWDPETLGLSLSHLAVRTLLPEGAVLTVAVDDTLFKRHGKKVFGAAWRHDGAARGTRPVGRGTCFVVLGIVVELPFCARPVCLPVMARLWRPKQEQSKVDLARLDDPAAGRLPPPSAHPRRRRRRLPRAGAADLPGAVLGWELTTATLAYAARVKGDALDPGSQLQAEALSLAQRIHSDVPEAKALAAVLELSRDTGRLDVYVAAAQALLAGETYLGARDFSSRLRDDTKAVDADKALADIGISKQLRQRLGVLKHPELSISGPVAISQGSGWLTMQGLGSLVTVPFTAIPMTVGTTANELVVVENKEAAGYRVFEVKRCTRT